MEADVWRPWSNWDTSSLLASMSKVPMEGTLLLICAIHCTSASEPCSARFSHGKAAVVRHVHDGGCAGSRGRLNRIKCMQGWKTTVVRYRTLGVEERSAQGRRYFGNAFQTHLSHVHHTAEFEEDGGSINTHACSDAVVHP